VVWSREILDRSSAAGQWDFAGLFPMYRLDGKTLGIVGVGRIGSRVARKLGSFGLRIIGTDPYLSDQRRAELNVEFVESEELFRTSDFVTVHTPLNEETRHMVNSETLGWMKETAYLINTSRGPMVDDEALAEAVRSGGIAGAAIDVYSHEPPPVNHPFFGFENIILTPHIGWASAEAGWEIRRSILDDILAAAEGRPARCIVNKEILD
jgi:D-3-phosphoglycerate dehydrogenase